MAKSSVDEPITATFPSRLLLNLRQLLEETNPTRHIAASVLALGRKLKELAEGNWAEVAPLVPDSASLLELQPLEKEIRARIRHLQDICQNPRSHLTVETERLRIGRVRRVAERAERFLAEHSEDWESRTLHSVYPKRILA